MRVAIPSKGRPNFLALSIFRDPIVFVEPQDFPAYQKANPNLDLAVLGKNNGGISYVRNSIIEHMGKEIFCMADDDITGLYEVIGGKVSSLKDSDILLKDMEMFMHSYFPSNLAIAGICPKAYAWCKDKPISFNTKILNIVFINGNLMSNLKYDENMTHGEDIDICIQALRSGRTTAVFNAYAYTNDMSKQPGGCGIRTKGEILKNIDYMNLKWGGDTVKPVFKNGTVSLKVKWTQS